MTRIRLLVLGGVLLLSLLPRTIAHAASPSYCDGPPPGAMNYRGTITVHAGIAQPCVVHILGGAVLYAGGGTAPQKANEGRAVFRVTGFGLDAPGAVTIVAGASTDPGNAPETLPLLKHAQLRLAPGTVLVRYDFAANKFVAVPNGQISLAFVPYKIIRRGATAMPQSAPPAAPATLPATGASPLRALPFLTPALLFLRFRRSRATPRQGRKRTRFVVPATGSVLFLALAGILSYVNLHGSPGGFGSLTGAGPMPRQAGASAPPTRLVGPSAGIDARITDLEVVGGAWQVPAYGAGYLTGSAWPGHAGNEAIAGHDDANGAVFRRLGDVHAGDAISVYAGDHAYRYRVTALRVVPPTRVDVLRPTRGATLTLITCTPYLLDTNRLIVRAELVS